MTEQEADAYEGLLNRFVVWAEAEPNLRGIVVLGSRARERRPAGEWSDLDLLVVTTNPDDYLSKTDWLSELGTPVLTFLESTAVGDGTERRALFEGGLDVDFVPVTPERIAAIGRNELEPDVVATFARGFRVVYDQDGIGQTLAAAVPDSPLETKPSSDEGFHELVADFWYHAV